MLPLSVEEIIGPLPHWAVSTLITDTASSYLVFGFREHLGTTGRLAGSASTNPCWGASSCHIDCCQIGIDPKPVGTHNLRSRGAFEKDERPRWPHHASFSSHYSSINTVLSVPVYQGSSHSSPQGWQGHRGARGAGRPKAAPPAGALGAAKFRGRWDSKVLFCQLVLNPHS